MKKEFVALIGFVLAILIGSAALNIYYYNSSQALMRRIQGTTLEVASGFRFSLLYASAVLESDAEPENIDTLVSHFMHFIHDAISPLRALRIYLLLSYEDSLLVIEDLLWNMSTGGLGGVSDTFSHLSWNISLKVTAFRELDLVASQKISEIGFEIREAFVSVRRDHIVETFTIIPSRLENALLITDDLKVSLDEWISKYSQM